jgi:DNA-binding transcriptional regulator YiaG
VSAITANTSRTRPRSTQVSVAQEIIPSKDFYYDSSVTRPGRRKRDDSRYAEQAQRLAEQLRSLRDGAGLSQQQLAVRAEVSVATVSKIETGAVREPGYFTVIAMLNALNAAAGEHFPHGALPHRMQEG